MRVLCKPVWVSEVVQLFLVPSRSSNPPFYPSKGCELGNAPRLLLLPLHTWAHIWVLWGVGGASSEVGWFKHELTTKKLSSLFWVLVPHTLFHFFSCLIFKKKSPLEKFNGEKILNLIKEWASYVHWKWRGWFVEIDHMIVQLAFLTLNSFYIFFFVFALQRHFVKLKIMHMELFKSLRMDT